MKEGLLVCALVIKCKNCAIPSFLVLVTMETDEAIQ
jgi:hypothetical protein